MKINDVKKQLLKEGIIFLALLLALGGGVFALTLLSDSYLNDKQALQGKVQDITTQAKVLKEKYFRVQQNTALYQEAMQKMTDNQLMINRQSMRDSFDQFKQQYFLNSLRLSASAVTDMKDAKYKRTNYIMVSSDVETSFDALSDEHIYSLIDAMEKRLPGASRLTKCTITRTQKLSNEAFRTISQKAVYPVVRGELKFLWLGIKPVDAVTDNANANPNPISNPAPNMDAVNAPHSQP